MTAFPHEPSDAPLEYAERRAVLPADLTGEAVRRLRCELLEYAADHRVRSIVVDCGAVEELAPYAMTVLVAASRRARAHGASLELRHPAAVVAQALDRLGLHKVLAVVADEPAPRP